MAKVLCKFNSCNGDNTGSYVRTGPGKSYSDIGVLVKKNCPDGFYIETTDCNGIWYRLLEPEKYSGLAKTSSKAYIGISKSWIAVPEDLSTLSKATNSTSTDNNTAKESGTKSNTTDNANSTTKGNGLDSSIEDYLKSKNIKDLMKNKSRIIGMPFQFTNVTDYRPYHNKEGLNFGRKYIENILAEAPIVYFAPGLPDYMPDADEYVKQRMDEYIKASTGAENLSEEVLKLIKLEEFRYYDFKYQYQEYMKYVNALCRVTSMFLGIGDKNVPGYDRKYKDFDWNDWFHHRYKTSGIINNLVEGGLEAAKEISETIASQTISASDNYIQVYVDPSSSFSESSSNSTKQSMISGFFDQAEDLIKEVGFFVNGNVPLDLFTEVTQSLSDVANKVNTSLDKNMSGGISKIISNANHIIQGSNIIFPELWSDSSYSRPYNFTVNLICPYADKESKFIYLFMPLMHLICLAFPRQTSANSFGSPFLVRAYAIGRGSCDLGIIDSISIEKSEFDVNGLPSKITVSFSVKELYSNLMISKTTRPDLLLTNTGLIEFLSVTSGLDISEGDIGLKMDLILESIGNMIGDMPKNLFERIWEALKNKLFGWFSVTGR